MDGLLDAALAKPWTTLDTLLDGPLHLGGVEATSRLLDRAEVGAGTRVLDVGCGAGDALELARGRGADAVGVDPSPNTGLAVRGDATALPVRDGRVDVLLAECVLCLTDLPAALDEAHRVLDDGGRLALSDVVVDGDRPGPDGRGALSRRTARSRSVDGSGRGRRVRGGVGVRPPRGPPRDAGPSDRPRRLRGHARADGRTRSAGPRRDRGPRERRRSRAGYVSLVARA